MTYVIAELAGCVRVPEGLLGIGVVVPLDGEAIVVRCAESAPQAVVEGVAVRPK